MTIHHHLSNTTLSAYAAGTLPEHMELVIATHLSMCPSCRKQLQDIEAIGGASLDSIPMIDMDDNALQAALSLIDSDTIQETPIAANDHDQSHHALPKPLRQFLPANINDVPWKMMAPGIKSYTLSGVNSREGTVRLLKISPGITIPEHGHEGQELTLILQGSFSDEVGRFKKGDIADLDDNVEHQPIADTAEDCICLIATEGPLKFKAMMPKLMQYFIGM